MLRQHVLSVQLSPTSSFSSDLGLDSLDAVEVVMAVEEASLRLFSFHVFSSS